MKKHREMLSERAQIAGTGHAESVLLRTVTGWIFLGRNDFGAPVDPSGALRYSPMAPVATLSIQAQIVSAQARMAAAGIAEAKTAAFPTYLARLLAHFLSPDGEPGLAEIVAADGALIDARRTLAGHAWIMRALADSFVATNASDLLLVADLVLEFLDRHLANDSAGYFEDNQGGGWRRQSSHATLLDAILTLHAATGSEGYLDRATALFELFRDHLLDRSSLDIGETFDRNWRPGSGERLSDPGVYAQWIVLLARYHDASGDLHALDLMQVLGERLLSLRNAQGLIARVIDARGEPAEPSHSLCDQLFLCGALQALGGGEGRLQSELRFLESRIVALFIDPAPAGCWCESVDARGVTQGAPVSMETLAAIGSHMADMRRPKQARSSQKQAMAAA